MFHDIPVLGDVSDTFLMFVLAVLSVMCLLCLLRLILGPSVADRLLAVNMLGCIVVAVIAVLGLVLEESYLLDISLIYALISFLAVVILFWEKMWPFQRKTPTQPAVRWDTIQMWCKVVVACIPGAVVTILFDDYIEAHLHTPTVIAAALILYGVGFILIENWNKTRTPKVQTLAEITYRTAFLIGLFQVLSIIPGTSRSGSTIIGALLIGVSRVAAAEFTFFLAVPVMFGLSLLKLLKFGLVFTTPELVTLVVGSLVAFLVSLVVIKFLMGYIKKHDFKVFGWYRIVLGGVVLAYFALK